MSPPSFDLDEWLDAVAPVVEAEAAAPTNGDHAAAPRPHNGHQPLARPSAWLAKCEPAISGQKGHDKLLWAAGVGPKFALADDEAFRLLRDEYNPRCEPPWTDQELRHKVAEAYSSTRSGANCSMPTDARPMGMLAGMGRNASPGPPGPGSTRPTRTITGG